MNHITACIQFIKEFKCPYCFSPLKERPGVTNDIINHECSCKDASYILYAHTNEYCFFLNLPGMYQLQIFADFFYLQSVSFRFVLYPEKDKELDANDALQFELNYIPEHLDWIDPNHLLQQLELMTIFQ